MVEYQGHGFTSQQMIDDVLEYSKVLDKIQSYYKAQSYTKATGVYQIIITQGVLGVSLMPLLIQKLLLRMYQASIPILIGLSHLMKNYTPSKRLCLRRSILAISQRRSMMSSKKGKWTDQPSHMKLVIPRAGDRRGVIANPWRPRIPIPIPN